MDAHSRGDGGPYGGQDCVLVLAVQPNGDGHSSVAWAIYYEYARDGEEPAVSVIAGGISQEETIHIVLVTGARGIPEVRSATDLY